MGFPNRGEGGVGSPTWEKFPHFPVFLFGNVPNLCVKFAKLFLTLVDMLSSTENACGRFKS